MSLNEPSHSSRLSNLSSHIPPGQFLRYLLVGGWNTLFGYGCFALLTAVLQRRFEHGYILASLLSSIINVTASYLAYKWFVFKTQGNYLREWLRSLTVYSTAILFNTAALPLCVVVLHRTTAMTRGAPYVAGGLLLGLTAIFSFIGHKKFSFKPPKD